MNLAVPMNKLRFSKGKRQNVLVSERPFTIATVY